MEVGDTVSFYIMQCRGYILYEQHDSFQIWGNDIEWVYMTDGVITNIIPMPIRPKKF